LRVVVLFVWIGAVVVAAVVLGFCAYELSWKAKRLRTDLGKLAALSADLETLQRDVSAIQLRMIEARH
jgi:outer membrane murein-binding lipoprotein Lpp